MADDVRYLTPPSIEVKKSKYCRFLKQKIKHIDYKNPDFLLRFLNLSISLLVTLGNNLLAILPT